MSVEESIQTALTADADLVALAVNGIWQASPPQGQARPYLVWQVLGSTPTEHTFTRKALDMYHVQFYAWAEDSELAGGPDTARAIISQMETALFDAALTVDGRTHLVCRKEMDLPDLEDAEGGGETAYGKGQQWIVGFD